MSELEKAWRAMTGGGEDRYARGNALKQIVIDGGHEPLCNLGVSRVRYPVDLARLVDRGFLRVVDERVSFVRKTDADVVRFFVLMEEVPPRIEATPYYGRTSWASAIEAHLLWKKDLPKNDWRR